MENQIEEIQCKSMSDLPNGKWRYSPVYRRWEKVIDYLMTEEWNGKNAYLAGFPKSREKVAGMSFSLLCKREAFKEFFKYLQETKYGVSQESLVAFWQSKMRGANKEDNAMRASENLAKFSQLQGFRKEDNVQPNVNVFVKFDE